MWFDIISVFVILAFAWRGAKRGAVWQLAVLGAIVLCIIFASRLSPVAERQLPARIEQPFREWIAVGVVYLGLSLVTFLIARKLRLWIEKIRFVEFDRHWGAILGATKGLLIVLVAISAAVVLLPDSRRPLLESHAGIVTRFTVRHASPLFPGQLAKTLNQAFAEPEEEGGLPRWEPPRLSSKPGLGLP